jgi:hypothetical protein
VQFKEALLLDPNHVGAKEGLNLTLRPGEAAP